MKKKDQEAIAKLYTENYVDYDGESTWIPSGTPPINDSALSSEEISDIYNTLETITDSKIDRLASVLKEKNNELYSHLTAAMKILYPLLQRTDPRDEY